MRKALVILAVMAMVDSASAALTLQAPTQLAVGEIAEYKIIVEGDGEDTPIVGILVVEGTGVLEVDTSGVELIYVPGLSASATDMIGDPGMLVLLGNIGILDPISALDYALVSSILPDQVTIPAGVGMIWGCTVTGIGEGTGQVHLVDMSTGVSIASQIITVEGTLPIADAGPDQRVDLLATVVLDGSASYDPDGLPDEDLTYEWSLISAPEGSTAHLETSDPAHPELVRTVDVPGEYIIQLVVSDVDGYDSYPDMVTITVRPPEATAAIAELALALKDIDEIYKSPGDFRGKKTRDLLIGKIEEALSLIEGGSYAAAMGRLQKIESKIDDVASSNNWITDGTAQEDIYGHVSAAIDFLTVLL